MTDIVLKSNNTPSTPPDVADIVEAELAINSRDGILYSSNGTAIFEIGANVSSISIGGSPGLTEADVHVTPVNNANVNPIASEWAYEHENAANPHSSMTTVGTLTSGNATAIVILANTTAAGRAEIATQAEVDAGSATNLIVTPETLNGWSGAPGGAGVTMANSAPGGASDGDLWWSTDEGQLRIYYTDANTSQWVDALAGPAGPTGATGLTGATGNKGGVEYTANTSSTANSDPGTGGVKFNNATAASVSLIWVDDLDNGSTNHGAWLDSFDDSTSTVKGILSVIGATDSDNTVAIFTVGGTILDHTGYREIPVTHVSGDLPSDSELIILDFTRTGDKGDTGLTGPQGDKGGVRYNFSTTTADADPGQGVIRFNNATIGSVTQLFIDNTDQDAVDVSSWLDTFDDSTSTINGTITINSNDNADATLAIFNVTGAVTDGTGYRKVAVSYVSGTLPSDAEELVIQFNPTGDKGDQGDKGGVRYDFDTTTAAADPGQGLVRFNNATFGSITQIYIDNTDVGATDVTSWLDTFDDSTSTIKGTLKFISNDNADTTIAIFSVTAIADSTGYRTISVTPLSGSIPSNAEELTVMFEGTGDKGDQGNIGPQGDKGGVRYDFDTTTAAADPGTGTVRFNNGTFGSITQIYIDNTDVGATDVTTWLDTFDDSTSTIKGVLSFISNDNADTTIALFDVTSIADSTGYRTIGVTPLSGSIPTNAEELIVMFNPTGDKGDQGNIGPQGDKAGIRYDFSTTTTDSDPGTGTVRFNSATPASITQVYIDNTDVNSTDFTAWLDSLDDSTSTNKGTLIFISNDNADTTVITFDVTGTVVDGTGYRKIGVTYVNGTLPSNAEELTVYFARTGDKGDTGDKGGVRYDFSTTTTDSDPGTGTVRFNSGTIASVTQVYLDNTDVNSVDMQGFLDAFDDAGESTFRGILTFISNNPADATIAIFKVTGTIVDGTGYRKATVSYLSGDLPSDAEELIVVFNAAGAAITTASDTAEGKVELATLTEVNTGTDTIRVIVPDTLAGSYVGTKAISVVCVERDTADSVASHIDVHVPPSLNGMELVYAHVENVANGSGTAATYNIEKNGVDMLSTPVNVDGDESGSDTAVTSYAIKTDGTEDIATNDVLTFKTTAVHGTTPATGVTFTVEFRLP